VSRGFGDGTVSWTLGRSRPQICVHFQRCVGVNCRRDLVKTDRQTSSTLRLYVISPVLISSDATGGAVAGMRTPSVASLNTA